MARFNGKFESHSVEWETPNALFQPLNQEFKFELDVCANKHNAKCARYFTKADNGLKQEWQGVCWMNPPFGREIKLWIEKAMISAQKGATLVCLVPARTNTGWWHDLCMKGEVRFVRGRPRFNNSKTGLPQPLAIVVFRPNGSGVLSPLC